MSTIDTLRRAEARIREEAGRATEGPWEAHCYDSGHSKFDMCCSVITADRGDHIADLDGLRRLENEVAATDDGYADATHIALWDPTVALAVADWLRAETDALEALDPTGGVYERVREEAALALALRVLDDERVADG